MAHYWESVSGQYWKLEKDGMESAQKFILAHPEHNVKLIELEPVPGTRALAFYITDFMTAWKAHTSELAMDSTCELSSSATI